MAKNNYTLNNEYAEHILLRPYSHTGHPHSAHPPKSLIIRRPHPSGNKGWNSSELAEKSWQPIPRRRLCRCHWQPHRRRRRQLTCPSWKEVWAKVEPGERKENSWEKYEDGVILLNRLLRGWRPSGNLWLGRQWQMWRTGWKWPWRWRRVNRRRKRPRRRRIRRRCWRISGRDLRSKWRNQVIALPDQWSACWNLPNFQGNFWNDCDQFLFNKKMYSVF